MILSFLCIVQGALALFMSWDARKTGDRVRHLVLLAVGHAWMIASVFAGGST